MKAWGVMVGGEAMGRNITIPIAVLIAAFVVSTGIIHHTEQGRIRMERTRVADLAGYYANELQVGIERSLSAT